ncbi:MAG: TolC family protein [Gemmatimonadaceae bacterium]|nr:TolC family protein [Gemmatimonadaceae bacterium]
MKRFVIALLIPMALHGQGVAGGDARPLSLEDAIRLAHQNSPLAIAARGQLRTTDAAVRTAFSQFLPTLSLSAGASRSAGEALGPNGKLVQISSPWNFNRGLSSNLELFDGFRRQNTLRSARAQQTAAESNERLQRYRVALEVKQQYFNVQASRESRGAALAQLAQAEEQLKAASARVTAGAATKSDSLRSVIAVGNARLAVLTAENSIRLANATLTRLVASPYTVTAAGSDSDAVAVVALDSVEVVKWLEDAPSISQARSDLAASVAAAKSSRASYWPTFSVGASLSGNRSDQAFAPSGGAYSSNKSLRLNFSYPLFNGLQREENVARTAVAEDNARAQLREARMVADQQLTQLLGSLRLAEVRLAIQEASVVAGEEDLRVQNQRYTLGASTLLDLLTSQSTLNQARYGRIQARYDARVAKAQIEALVGRDIP